ncbi:MAG: hypothetical protein ACLP19_27205 [Xanthobacteraceae bacterium]
METKNYNSPTFVARFADGTVTRMSTYCGPGKLDAARGVRIAWAAYESRKKRPAGTIIQAHFERNGEILQRYAADQLAAVIEDMKAAS